MAKNNHITSDHWKVGGNGHNGENLLHEINKSQYALAEAAKHEEGMIPGQDNPHPETPAAGGGQKRAGNATPSSNTSKNRE
jgi:hypothetical protein